MAFLGPRFSTLWRLHQTVEWRNSRASIIERRSLASTRSSSATFGNMTAIKKILLRTGISHFSRWQSYERNYWTQWLPSISASFNFEIGGFNSVLADGNADKKRGGMFPGYCELSEETRRLIMRGIDSAPVEKVWNVNTDIWTNEAKSTIADYPLEAWEVLFAVGSELRAVCGFKVGILKYRRINMSLRWAAVENLRIHCIHPFLTREELNK
jgi:hypothetical protein